MSPEASIFLSYDNMVADFTLIMASSKWKPSVQILWQKSSYLHPFCHNFDDLQNLGWGMNPWIGRCYCFIIHLQKIHEM